LQRKDWAVPEIREQIGAEGGAMSGHHIVSKEDLTQLRQWAVDDYNADKKNQPNAFAFFQAYPDPKLLWNIGYNITVGPSDYTNNPGNTWDPGTESVALGAEDEGLTGLSLEELGEYGVERRKNTKASEFMAPLQARITARRGNQAAWSDAAWGEITALFKTGAGRLKLDPATVNPYDEDEWADDIGLRKVQADKDELTLVGAAVQVDGEFVSIDNGVLSINDEALDLGELVPTNDGGNLKIAGAQVTWQDKDEEKDKDAGMMLNGKPLKSWVEASYRKRAGLVMTNLDGAGESIFQHAADNNRRNANNPSHHIGFETVSYNGLVIRSQFKLGHILLRHSFQWWGGESTNKNIFFMPGMNDDAIFNWCKEQIKIFRETMVEPAFKRRKRQIEHEEATNGYAEDPSFSLSFAGNANGIYIDAVCNGEPDDKPVPDWKIDVNVKTMAPSEANGMQVTKLALVDFKKNHPVLPAVAS
jgi:hypothetical protein